MTMLIDTKTLEKYVVSLYEKAAFLMRKDEVYVPLNTVFRKNESFDGDGIFCFTEYECYHFRVIERGIVYKDHITKSLSEIGYLAIEGDILEAAAIYESKNRVPNQDFRRIMFSKMVQYFEAVDYRYAQKAILEIEDILKRAPFMD